MSASTDQLAVLSEKKWTAQLLELGRTLGWKRYHTYRSTKSASGFPDEVWVRERVLFMEVKTEKGKVSAAQAEWIRSLHSAQAEVWVVRPRHLEEIGKVLSRRFVRYDHSLEFQMGADAISSLLVELETVLGTR